ncbi:uncharacterized protein J4E79_001829 [Alternaria viburni]|uniref:uncharacterized protein n=1 Tax=Alternaria viburni TaxID=566460 RepID=UPI0020C24A24|nr:uncharacterized protein J4E79_001829 [Alternaria viburni]KAI4667145.1 hypothetical protein J4E79_001829 [Alternaria viburni]
MVTVNGMQYLVECGADYQGGDIPGPMSPTYPSSYEGCLADCSTTSGCVAASYIINGPCYLKSAANAAGSNSNIIGGRLVRSISTKSATSASSAAPASSSAAASSMTPASSSAVASSSAAAPSAAPASSSMAASSSAAASSPVSTSSRVSSSVSSSSSAVAASSAPVTSAAPAPGPSTVTVTTTISNTAYQCACTPASVFAAPSSTLAASSSAPAASSSAPAASSSAPAASSSAPAASPTGATSCPGSNGSMVTTSCGAVYAVECSSDRFGNDLENGLVYTDTYEQCLQACDNTTGCVNVSWVIGKPGACYMKGSIGDVRVNSNIIGGRKLSGCSTFKLHRKRVAFAAPKVKLNKRAAVDDSKAKLEKRAGFFGPDFTFTQAQVTATSTATARTTVTM